MRNLIQYAKDGGKFCFADTGTKVTVKKVTDTEIIAYPLVNKEGELTFDSNGAHPCIAKIIPVGEFKRNP